MAEGKTTILLVDDDKFLLDMYSVKFKESGFEIEVAVGAEEALKKITDGFKPDAILLDLVMPGLDGFGFLEKVRKDNLIGGAAVLMLTNQGQESDIERARTLGADGYIVKASSIPSEVVEKTSALIQEKQKK
jgi:two-component system OmpR family response regulator